MKKGYWFALALYGASLSASASVLCVQMPHAMDFKSTEGHHMQGVIQYYLDGKEIQVTGLSREYERIDLAADKVLPGSRVEASLIEDGHVGQIKYIYDTGISDTEGSLKYGKNFAANLGIEVEKVLLAGGLRVCFEGNIIKPFVY